ncbi:hypothetical protein M5689_017264 [Euphorbia peplus]|nr:hypothetical protein M5689_017264 [Euphorbia peplus]
MHCLLILRITEFNLLGGQRNTDYAEKHNNIQPLNPEGVLWVEGKVALNDKLEAKINKKLKLREMVINYVGELYFQGFSNRPGNGHIGHNGGNTSRDRKEKDPCHYSIISFSTNPEQRMSMVGDSIAHVP